MRKVGRGVVAWTALPGAPLCPTVLALFSLPTSQPGPRGQPCAESFQTNPPSRGYGTLSCFCLMSLIPHGLTSSLTRRYGTAPLISHTWEST